MSSWEIVALNTTVPQLMAPQSGDTYSLPRPLVGAVGSFAVSTPVLDLSQTWNAGGVTFTGMKFNVTDTASATASRLFDLQVGGADRFHVTKAGAGHFAFSVRAQSNSAVISLGASDDTILARDAANTLALRNGASAQTFNVYNTYTDVSNYRRALFDTVTTAGSLRIGMETLGTGGAIGGVVLVAGANSVTITPGASNLATFNGSITSAGNVTISNGGAYTTTSRGYLAFTGNGVFSFNNADASNNFTLTAGASNLATFNGGVKALGATAIPAGGTAGAGLTVSSTSNFGVFFGSGAPSLSAAKGSLYLRSDGSGVADRMYVNTNGSTTWTAVTTVA